MEGVDKIVDNNTLFPHLMMAISTDFAYMDLYRQLLSTCCTWSDAADGRRAAVDAHFRPIDVVWEVGPVQATAASGVKK